MSFKVGLSSMFIDSLMINKIYFLYIKIKKYDFLLTMILDYAMIILAGCLKQLVEFWRSKLVEMQYNLGVK
jgi:hypothetical protein